VFLGARLYQARQTVSPKEIAGWVSECQKPSEAAKTQCWEDVIRRVVKERGVKTTFDLISAIHDADPQFAQTCHAMVHIVGQQAYGEFRTTGTVALSPKAAICAFGFYHGFMEMLVARKGTIIQAREFCDYVDKTLGSETPNAKFGCAHGIGHGSTDIHNPQFSGKERELVAQAIPNCEAFARDDHELTLCATGIFDSIALAYYNDGENGLVMKKDDPLWLCREQPKKYKEACYRDMMPAVIWMGEHDLPKAAAIVFAHAEEAYKVFALEPLAENSIRFIVNKKPITAYLPFCRSLAGDAYEACIRGLAAGVMQFGHPEKEYEDALAFCKDDALTDAEEDICMKRILDYAKGRYSAKRVAAICASAQDRWQRYCQPD